MGITERKERERAEMRKMILEAARHLFLANGYEKVSIRNIADAIEYSPATIYLYYKDKNDLLYALHQEAFGKLIEKFKPVFTVDDPFERLVRMGQQYIHYAFENPEMFDLMFIMTAPLETLECREDVWDEGRIAFNMLVQVVQQCIDAGVFKHQDAERASLMIWSMVHGLSALFLRKRMMIFSEERRGKLMQEAFELFSDTIRKGL
ncbi:TetR/AcrR family transcriptional regulator [Nibrella saemangeumensis]